MQNVLGADALENSPGHLWQVPGRHLSVRLAQTVVDVILARAERRDARGKETGGLLLGRVEHSDTGVLVIVERAAEVPSEHLFGARYAVSETDRELFEELIGECAVSTPPLNAVGFYRTHERKGLGLDDDDLALFEELFPGPDHIALLLKRRLMRPARAGIFFREEGRIQTEASYLELDLRPGAAAEPVAPSKSLGLDAPPSFSSAPVPEPEDATLELERKRRFLRWYSLWVQVPLLLSLLVVYFLLGYLAPQQLRQVIPIAHAQRDPYALSLMVLEYGDNLHLSWDRKAVPIETGTGGMLHITDGEQTHTLDLSTEQLRGGSVSYRRLTPQVRFQLEVFLRQHRSVSESWQPAPGSQH